MASGALRCLYPSKSNNSPGFLLAVLKAVGLVQVSLTNPRCYEVLDPAAFIADAARLRGSEPEFIQIPKLCRAEIALSFVALFDSL
jgi:hypothetical protein